MADETIIPIKVDTPIPYYKNGGVTLYNGDCVEIIPNIHGPNLVVTDPPWIYHGYTIQMEKERATTHEAEVEWFKQIWAWFASWMSLIRDADIQCGWYFLGWYRHSVGWKNR